MLTEEVWWKSLDAVGLESLRLTRGRMENVAESVILRIENYSPYQLNYRIRCDDEWYVREVSVHINNDIDRLIELKSDGNGNWLDKHDGKLPEFSGCFDIDISATPFTNTLPLQRVRLDIGEKTEISVVYFLIPEMTLTRSEQTYERLGENLYKFEEKGISDGFSAEIELDENNLVVDYPQLFKRIHNK